MVKKHKFTTWKWTPEGLQKMEFMFTDKPTCDELPIGGIMPGPGTSRLYKTGGWRSSRPVLDESKCNKCGLCWIYCPDICVTITPEGNYKVDLDYCKGCGICAEECPANAITMVEEEV